MRNAPGLVLVGLVACSVPPPPRKQAAIPSPQPLPSPSTRPVEPVAVSATPTPMPSPMPTPSPSRTPGGGGGGGGGTPAGPRPTTSPSATPMPSPSLGPIAPSAPPPPAGAFVTTGQLPQPMVWHRAVLHNGSVYVTGGTNGTIGYTATYKSPLGKWNWQSQSPLPLPTEGHGFVIVDQHAYVIGGWGRPGPVRATVYHAPVLANGNLGVWSAVMPLPQGRAYHAVAQQGNQIVVLGGWNPSFAPTETVWTTSVNPDGSLAPWQTAPNLPDVRAWGSACTPPGKLVFSGGSNGSGTQASVYEAPFVNGQIGSWAMLTPLPQPIEGHTSLVYNQQATTVGGDHYINLIPHPIATLFQLSSDGWTEISSLPAPRFGQAMVQSGNHLMLFGGHDSQHAVLSDILEGDP